MSQNQAKSNYKDCSFGNRDSFLKGTRLSVFNLFPASFSSRFSDSWDGTKIRKGTRK